MKVIKKGKCNSADLTIYEEDGKFILINSDVGLPCEFETLEEAELIYNRVVDGAILK